MAVIRIDLMQNWMMCYTSANGFGPKIILALAYVHESGPLTEDEYLCLCDMLLVPVRYSKVSIDNEKAYAAHIDKLKAYVAQIEENADNCKRFIQNCQQVITKLGELHDRIHDNTPYCWLHCYTVGLNIMGNIVYNMITQGISYKQAAVIALNNVCWGLDEDLIDIAFIYDFFNDYFMVEMPDGTLLTPSKVLGIFNQPLGRQYACKFCVKSDLNRFMNMCTGRSLKTYTPWVSSIRLKTPKATEAKSAKVTVRGAMQAKNGKNPKNVKVVRKCSLERYLDTEYPIFVVYNHYRNQICQKLATKMDVDCAGFDVGTVITDIIIYTGKRKPTELTSDMLLHSNDPDIIRLKPTEELNRYLLCRARGCSPATNVLCALRGRDIMRENVTNNVDIIAAFMQYVYFTDEYGTENVPRERRKYIHISQLEMYLLGNTINLRQRLDNLTFYVKIDNFYIEVVHCGLDKAYKDVLLQLAQYNTQ